MVPRTLVLVAAVCISATFAADPVGCIREGFEAGVGNLVKVPAIALTPDVTLTLRAFNNRSPFQEVDVVGCLKGATGQACWVAGGVPPNTAVGTVVNTGEPTNQGQYAVSDHNGQGSGIADYVLEFSQCMTTSDFAILVYDFAADGGANGDLAVMTAYADVARTQAIASDQFPAFASIPDGAAVQLTVQFPVPTEVCAVGVNFFKADGVTPTGDVGVALDNVAVNCLAGPIEPPCGAVATCADDCFTLTNTLGESKEFEYALSKHQKANNAVVGSSNTGLITLAAGASTQFCATYDHATQYASFSAFVPGSLGVCAAKLEDCPECTIPDSEWLVTQYEPHLNVAQTGFVTGTPDIFRWSWDNHRKYMNTYFTVTEGNSDALETEAVQEHTSLTNQAEPACWDAWKLDIAWGDMVQYCSRDDTSDAQFVIYTCKLAIDGNESLNPIRSTPLSRIVHNELPVQVLFPKQVSASVADLSAFQPPNVLAAIVRQEVNVDVTDLGVASHVNLFTSVQYPFRLTGASWDAVAAAPQPTGINGGAVSSVSDCTPYPDAGDSPGQPGDANACNQVWRFDLDVIGGADPGQSVCELDGDYYVQFNAVCLPTFPSDCPLVKDDQGVLDDIFRVKMTLDSEYFCPQVVDQVDVAAAITVWKDLAHGIAATNFILGQTTYLVAKVSSNKVTVAGVQLDDLSYNRGAGVQDVVVDKVDNNALSALTWFDSGATATNGQVVPDDETWIQFQVTEPQFAPPVDGSEDFSVSVTLDVQFKDAALQLLSEKVRFLAANRQLGAEASSQVSANEDTTSSAASQTAMVALAAAGIASALAM